MPTLVMLVLLPFAVAGCFSAPELSGDDQVHDLNIEVTRLKDNDLEALVWPEVDTVLENLLPNANEPGCAVGIARGGEPIYLEGYGKAVLGGANWSVGTMGAVGSVSKTLTAAAALKMHRLGLIDVNASVGAHLSTSNGPLASTGVHALMNHSGGVGGATQIEAFAPTWWAGSPVPDCFDIDPGEAAACAAASQLAARPETAFSWYEADETVSALADGDPGNGVPHEGVYSNVGYSVLGALIDDAAQGSPSGGYEAWVWDEIGVHTGNVLSADNLLSLALNHSWRDGDVPYRARGYVPDDPGFDLAEAFDPAALGDFEGWEGPSGGWLMTIGDLTRLAVALQANALVGGGLENAMRLEWTALAGWANDRYGMGMFLSQNGARPPQWHGGAIGGHRAAWGVWDSYAGTGTSLAVTMMCNRSDVTPWNRLNTIAAATLGTAPRVGALVTGASTSRTPSTGRALDGQAFALDFSGAWQARPRDAILPFLLEDTLRLETVASARGLDVALATTRPDDDPRATIRTGEAQPLGRLEVDRDASFSTATRDVTLDTASGRLRLEDVEIDGRVAARGQALDDLAVRFRFDTRQTDLLGLDSAAVCELAKGAGARCEPCDDGARACLAMEYRGVRAGKAAASRDAG